jgi:hypothetical protein
MSLWPAMTADYGPGEGKVKLPERVSRQETSLCLSVSVSRQDPYGMNVNFAWLVTAFANPSSEPPGGRT